MPHRKIYPPDEKPKKEYRIEFLATKKIRDDLHAFKRNYDFPNLAVAIERLLKLAERYPNFIKPESM